MSIEQFMTDTPYRQRFWAGARVGSSRFTSVAPNAGHIALAHLEAASRTNGVITQNVDGLHRRAGSRTVVELHGSGGTIRCTNCDLRVTRIEVLGWFDALNPGYAEQHAGAEIAPDGDAAVAEVDSGELNAVEIPPCPVCGGILRPNVVYFGETVPPEVFAAAEALLNEAGALLLVGTSLAVNTGVRLVHRAERRGIPIAVINRGPTAVDARADIRVEGGTTEVLTELATLLQ
jgi:NAD-dependent SIR2 family protein deacetylase